jgi:hypothetical protein
MADNPDAPIVQTSEVRLIASDLPHAPVIYFENAPALGCIPGVIRVTLSTGVMLPTSDGKVKSEEVVVGYLRCNIPAALSLRKALDDALLLAAPTAEGKAN